MVLSLRGSTTTNGGENSSSAEFGGQLTPEEEAIMDEIKQLADIVNKHEENFAKINQTLTALQQQINQQIQISTPTVQEKKAVLNFRVLVATNLESTVAYPKSAKIDMELRVADPKSKFRNQDSSIREGSTTTITGQ